LKSGILCWNSKGCGHTSTEKQILNSVWTRRGNHVLKEEIGPWRMEKGRGRKVCPPFLRFKTLKESLLGISLLPSSIHLLTLLVPSSALHVHPIDLYQCYIFPLTPHANISSVSLPHHPKTHILSVDELS